MVIWLYLWDIRPLEIRLATLTKRTINRRTRPRKQDITCKKATGLIIDYLDGELDPEVNSAFEEHLRDCPDCVAFLKTYKKIVQIFKSLYRNMPSKKINKRSKESMKERIKNRSRLPDRGPVKKI